MNKTIFIWAALLVAAAGCGTSSSGDPARKLEGEWIIVDLNENGKSAPPTGGTRFTVTIKDQRWYRGQEGGGSAATNEGASAVRVNMSKEPAQIDVVRIDGPNVGKAQLGVFAFEGEKLKISLGQLGGARAEYLHPGDKNTLLVLERKK
jgi:uncharacterized protein (TIGR03067 family)